jgi:hypothetical protein
MAIERIPLIASTDAEGIVSNAVSAGELTQNVLFSKYSNGRTYAQQRPGVTVFVRDDDDLSTKRPRAIFYWETTQATYIVNGNVIYKGGYDNPVGTIGAGKERAYFIPFSPTELIIYDPINNDGWVMYNDDSIVHMRSGDVPGLYEWPGDRPGIQLVGGGAYLDGYFFIMDSEGKIWNSEVRDPLSGIGGPLKWPLLNFTVATREPDDGLFLTKHHEHLVAIGSNTVEFFYDAGNPLASPLQRRDDLTYRVGAYSASAVFNSGDNIYFVGTETTGTLGVFRINRFNLTKISDDGQDTYLNRTLIRGIVTNEGPPEVLASGGPIGEHSDVVYFTFCGIVNNRYDARYTLVYDGTHETWGNWTTKGLPSYPVVGVTSVFGVNPRNQSLLFLDSEVAEYQLQGSAVDGESISPYVNADYYVRESPADDSYSLEDYIEQVDVDTGTNIEMIIRIPEYDGGTMTNKFCHKFELVGSPINADEDFNYLQTPVRVRWSDDHYATWQPELLGYRDLWLHADRWKLTRLGKFNRRSFEIFYNGNKYLRLEAVEIDVRASQYA